MQNLQNIVSTEGASQNFSAPTPFGPWIRPWCAIRLDIERSSWHSLSENDMNDRPALIQHRRNLKENVPMFAYSADHTWAHSGTAMFNRLMLWILIPVDFLQLLHPLRYSTQFTYFTCCQHIQPTLLNQHLHKSMSCVSLRRIRLKKRN